jgi:hypothetical protein
MPYIMNDTPKPKRPFLTPWFAPGVEPVRDGVYLTAHIHRVGQPSECWHAMRWNGKRRAWFSAGSTGAREPDLIGMNWNNRRSFQWRGLAQDSRGKP